MTPVPAENEPRVSCWSCERDIDREDHYCRWCAQGQGAWIPWYYRPLALAFLAVTVLGPFTLPLVWRSPYLGRDAKWVASVVLVALTGYVGWQLVVVVGALSELLAAV